MHAMLILDACFAAMFLLGTIWIVPVSLTAGSVACFMMAVRRGVSWRLMRFGWWQFAVWIALAAVASSFAVGGALNYNASAGTDKTPMHIVQISAAVLAGPMVGPVANSAASNTIPEAKRWTVILAAVLFATCSPVLFLRRMVSPAIAILCWTIFIAGTLLWFYSAMISMMVFLS